jgi:SAM-dependent methyltransferase
VTQDSEITQNSEAAQRIRSQLEQEDREYCLREGIADLPPAVMRFRVIGDCSIGEFFEGGERTREALESAVLDAGKPIDVFRSALDFGCGCGRVVRAFRRHASFLKLHATDVDAEAIAWCRQHLPSAGFRVNDGSPPLPYADGQFDLIWAISVFTHLDEERQFTWLAELRRILRPGGILLATVYGRPSWESSSAFWQDQPVAFVRSVEEHGFYFANTGADDSIFPDTFPDWYQMTWHTRDYVEREWARYFDIRLYRPQGMLGDQDLIVAEKPVC